MKIVIALLITVSLSLTSGDFLTLEKFKTEIGEKCYNYKNNEEMINGQLSPIPSSLEAFVSIVDKLEGIENRGLSPAGIISSIIAKSRFDDLTVKPDRKFGTREPSKDVISIHLILQKLFESQMYDALKTGDLNDDEVCALYFMISHTVNATVVDKSSKQIISDDSPQPREQGVVNLNGKTRHAFALGKVLLGILAGLQNSKRTVDATDILKALAPAGTPVPDYLLDVKINVLHGATISDIIAYTLYIQEKKTPTNGQEQDMSKIFYPNGIWDDAVCPTKYILDDINSGFDSNTNTRIYATRAQVRGAIDGLVIGSEIEKFKDAYAGFTLSQVLRTYYSSGNPGFAEVTWCNRPTYFGKYRSEIKEEAIKYYKLYAAINSEDTDVSKVDEGIDRILNQIESVRATFFEDISSEDINICRRISSSSSGNRACETPRDITVIFDGSRGGNQEQMQLEIIGNLTVGLHMGDGGSSASVYSNLRPTGGGNNQHMINISDISGCASCATKYLRTFESISTTPQSPLDVIRAMTRTLDQDDDKLNGNTEVTGGPAKVVLYFMYGNTISNHELREAIWDFRQSHRGTKVFAIGTSIDSLKPFVENVDNDIFVKNDAASVLTSLSERVCQVPAQFQFTACNRSTSTDNSVHRGYITPYHTQYWAMYPKYFLKSYRTQLTFSTSTDAAVLKVCFTRNNDQMYGIGERNLNCQQVTKATPYTFYENYPCKNYNVDTCRPFYFRVEATKEGDNRCSEKDCRTPSQVDFEFKHSGISCNRGFSFVTSPMTMAVALLISMIYFFKH